MERQGKLEPYKIYRLLQSLAVAKASCVVVVSYESGGIRISMSEGNVVFLDSDILHYRFPAFLMKTGMISEKVVEEVLLKAEHSEEKFEETLIQSNLMKREDIEKAKHSIVRTLLTVVMSAEGSYSVDMNPSPLPDAAKYTLNLDEALFRNVGMQKDAAFFKRFLTAHKGISLKKTHLFAKLLPLMNSFIFRSKSPGFSLPAEESFMLVNSMIDDDAAAQALFSMIMSGMIAPESGRTQKEAPEPAQAHFQVNGREAHPAYKALLEELDQMKSKNYFELFSVQIDAPP
ncbi:MAG: hypothetical protein FJ088_13400, partial [Deltaproteobacteria bacterium]|nr:hypothetical protein [Deltaproteobacteria bacterium]